MIKPLFISSIAFLALASIHSAQAIDVNITKTISYIETTHEGQPVKIIRNQDQNHHLTGSYTKTSRKCPPFCIQPMKVADGVTTIGELELLNFIQDKVNNGVGLLIDARTPAWHKKGTIPGSINIPFTSFQKDTDPITLEEALIKLGAIKKDDSKSSILQSALSFFSNKDIANSQWDFSEAKDLALWCNGMWCGQSPHAIKGLLALGYPANKIYYYRGGMQAWQSLGFNTIKPK